MTVVGGDGFQPFPELGRKWPISTDGGSNPVWTRNGQELVFLSGNWVMTARVVGPTELEVEAQRRLFMRDQLRLIGVESSSGRAFDVTADGRRFAWIEPGPNESSPTEIHVVFNWFEELEPLAGGTGGSRR